MKLRNWIKSAYFKCFQIQCYAKACLFYKMTLVATKPMYLAIINILVDIFSFGVHELGLKNSNGKTHSSVFK